MPQKRWHQPIYGKISLKNCKVCQAIFQIHSIPAKGAKHIIKPSHCWQNMEDLILILLDIDFLCYVLQELSDGLLGFAKYEWILDFSGRYFTDFYSYFAIPIQDFTQILKFLTGLHSDFAKCSSGKQIST